MTDQDNEEEYFSNLEKSFEANKNSPGVLLSLGEVYLRKGDLERSENLANRALEIVDNLNYKGDTKKELKSLKSNLLVLLGKIVHSRKDYKKAFKYYEDAVNHQENNSIALHYYGTMHLHLRNYKDAEKSFEKVLKLTEVDSDKQTEFKPLNIETMKILAQTKVRMMKRDEAIALLDTILKNDRNDIEAYLLAAYLNEQKNFPKALDCYIRAIKILEADFENLKKTKEEKDLTEEDYVNPIFYNNLAVLHMKLNEGSKAKTVLIKARDVLKKLRANDKEDIKYKSIALVLSFNEACYYESTGKIGTATNIYKKIIEDEPSYVDAYLRLAILAKQRGDKSKAIKYGELAVNKQSDKKPVVPYCVLGNFYMEDEQFVKADQEFRNALTKNPHDSYAYISTGNIFYNSSCKYRDNPKKQEEKLRQALRKYMKALEYDDSNAFAANCIGNIIGEYGMIDEAMEIYKAVGENHPEIPHSMINSGHILASQNRIPNALKLYEKVLEKFYNGRHDQIELWIARLHYMSKSYEKCEKILKKMVQRNPSDIVPSFNLALCLQSKSIDILNKDFREVKETKKTIQDLELAKKIFAGLSSLKPQMRKLLPSNCREEKLADAKKIHSRIHQISEERLFFITETLKNPYLDHDIAQEQKNKELLEQNQKKIHEIEEAARLREEEEKQKKLNLIKEKESKALQQDEIFQQMAKEWADEDAKKRSEEEFKKSTKGKREKKSKRKQQDDFLKSDDEDQDGDYNQDQELLRRQMQNEEELKEAGLSREEAENLGSGGLADLQKAHKKKHKKEKRKKDKKKKDKKSKKSRLKRNRNDPDQEFGDEQEPEPTEEKRQKFDDE